ncbi:hypothetical protein TNCT_242381 [Trichonephila clavata]|uniref:Uncharacterized protein n=1 Tax=Trichonephila clavata TaxID=2740835 RepID=A0A8X6LIF0_TRICU|nr:hypothetical protein TNCT_242381 [Trichonephila clavata]
MPNWLIRQRVETDGSSATLCRTASTLSSVRIFQWHLFWTVTTEPRSSKQLTKLFFRKTVEADLELKYC